MMMAKRTWSMAALALVVGSACLALSVVGCGGRGKRMSEYPYFIETLDRRWEVAREAFQRGDEGVAFAPVLLKDLSGTASAMDKSYHADNRDEVIATFNAMVKEMREALVAKLDWRSGQVTLRAGATAEDIAEIVDKYYQEYLQIREKVRGA